jgi:hypothetical protein
LAFQKYSTYNSFIGWQGADHDNLITGELAMNINKTIIARIEEYRATNKNPCKSYATEAAAEKATAQMAQDAANYFHKERGVEARPAQYVVIYNEAWGRWVGAVNMTELIQRSSSTGGYIGYCTGFFVF